RRGNRDQGGGQGKRTGATSRQAVRLGQPVERSLGAQVLRARVERPPRPGPGVITRLPREKSNRVPKAAAAPKSARPAPLRVVATAEIADSSREKTTGIGNGGSPCARSGQSRPRRRLQHGLQAHRDRSPPARILP